MTGPTKKQIFISYSRTDSTGFARQLHKRLNAIYDCWVDFERMPNRGQPFPQEIEQAISNSDALLLVLSPAATSSKWVEKEWQFAHHSCVPIIPLLHLGLGQDSFGADVASLPEELSTLNVLDFQDDSFGARDDAYQKLEQALQVPAPKMGIPHNVPSIPNFYFSRDEDLKNLNAMILRNIHRPVVITSAQQATALQGMGGIGKTVLASVFARQCETRRLFKDGIFWFLIGQNPSSDKILSFIASLGSALGDDTTKYGEYNIACSRLCDVLNQKNVLIVLDNVWDVEAVQPFKSALGSACRLLITTRSMDISRRLTGHEQTYKISTLNDDQAVNMLRLITKKSEAGYYTIAQRLGGLPLALYLVGNRLLQGMTAQEWLDTYDKASSIRLGRHPRTSDESLMICIDLSVDKVFDQDDETSKQLYFTLGIFPEQTWIPENVVVQMWMLMQRRPDVSRQDLFELIDDLADLALIERNTINHTIHLHDLLHDYNREKLGTSYVAMQAIFLRSYNYNERPWYQVPDDGYLYNNLAYHLIRAEKPDVLQSLLLSYGWLQAKLTVSGRVSSVIADFDAYLNAEITLSETKREVLEKIKVAIQLSTYVLAIHKDQLWSQLYGRLMRQKEEEIQQFVQQVPAQSWIRPDNEYLMPPGTALKYTLGGHIDSVLSLGGVVGAGGFISSVSVSANSEIALTGSFDGTVKIWDIQLGHLVETLRGHKLPVTAVAMTGDGTWAVSGSIDNSLFRWDLRNNTISTRCYASGLGSVFSVAISADGNFACAGYQNGSLVLWDIRTGEMIHQYTGHDGAVVAVAMNADATRAITGSHDRTVRYWNLNKGELIHGLAGHQGPVHSVSLHKSDFAVSSSADGSLRVWDLISGETRRVIQVSNISAPVPIRSVTLDSSGQHAISGSYAGAIQIWRLSDGEKVYEVFAHSRQIMSLAMASDGVALLSGGCDNVLRIWDLREKAPAPAHTAAGRGLFSLAVHRESDLLATVDHDYSVNLWSIKNRIILRNLRGHKDTIQCITISGDGTKLVTGAFDHTVQIWDIKSGERLHTLKGPESNVLSVALSPNGKVVAAGYSGANRATSIIKTWSLETGDELMTYEGHEDDVVTLAFTPDSLLLLSGSDDTTVRIWNMLTGKEILVFRQHQDIVKSIVVSNDGSFVVSGGCDRAIHMWDIKTGKILRTFTNHQHFIWTVRLSPDNTKLLSTSEDHSLRIWDLKANKMSASFFCDNVAFTGDFVSDDLIVIGTAASREPYFFTLIQSESTHIY